MPKEYFEKLPPYAAKQVDTLLPYLGQLSRPRDLSLWEQEARTEAANGRFFAANFGSDFRWCEAWGRWLHFTGSNWTVDDSCQVELAAKQVGDIRFQQAGDIVANAEATEQLKKAVIAFAKASNSRAGINNMVSLAHSEPGMSISPDQLDSNPMLLNVRNGTIELTTGKLLEHRQDDFISKMIDVEYDPFAQCPTFIKTVESIFAQDQELIDFVQRFFGYCITGSVAEQLLAICYGDGSNGKSLLFTTFVDLLGPYAGPAQRGFWLAASLSRILLRSQPCTACAWWLHPKQTTMRS